MAHGCLRRVIQRYKVVGILQLVGRCESRVREVSERGKVGERSKKYAPSSITRSMALRMNTQSPVSQVEEICPANPLSLVGSGIPNGISRHQIIMKPVATRLSPNGNGKNCVLKSE